MRTFGYSDFWFIIEAAQWTIALSIMAFIGGGIVGLIVALSRSSDNTIARGASMGFIKLFQGTPLLLQLFLVFFGASVLGFNINPWIAAAIGLRLHAMAYLGDIWRGCIEAVPKGQWEASRALGLTYGPMMNHVVLPQAVKIALPPTVGFLVQLIKLTSVTAIIGFIELTRTGQIINNVTFKPFLVFSVVAGIYFILCWPLSYLSARLERRYAAATR